MSNGEVKRWYIYSSEDGALHVVSKNQRGFVPDSSTIKVMPVDDHERIVAAKDAAYDSLDNVNMKLNEQVAGLKEELEVFRNREYGLENELELKQTIATQARVIGNLKGTLEGILVFADDADMRREFARRALEKLAAIEQGEGT